jgi:hypothetical protein
MEFLRAYVPTITVFGEQDRYAPTSEKMKNLNAHCEIIPNSDHEFYRNSEVLSHVLQGGRIMTFIRAIL